MTEYDVFLSHNNSDKPAVEELARRLTKEGIQPWLDIWNLIPGEPWQEAIEDALEHCAACVVSIGPSGTGPWQNEEMRAAIDRRVKQSEGYFRVIPVLLPGAERGERSRLPTFLVATTWVEFRGSLDDKDAFHRLVCGIRGLEPGPGPGQAIYEGECPYRGLKFFDVEHAPFFFGREALTEWLLDSLRGDSRFLGIIGPSGSGKSSLARAGLVAALKQGAIEGSSQWPIVICRPGLNPVESLAVALSQDTSDALALISKFHDNERALHITARIALRDAPPERKLVVFVDQFEEVFTLCHDKELRRALIDNLLYTSSVSDGQTMILLAMRADFYGKCGAYPTLAAALSDHQMLVGPMTEDELRRAIERPASLVGLEFEGGLVEALLRDVETEPGALPLLQHTLFELWERREGRRLNFTTYRQIGGVQGAIAHRAESIYAGFDPTQQAITRRIMLRLTQPGEGTEDTRRRAQKRELLTTDKAAEATEDVIQTLTDARLVTTAREVTTGEEYVDVSHEALILGWPRMREWIDEDRAGLQVHRRLTQASTEWERSNRDRSYLYSGGRLAEAQEWADAHADDLNPLEQEFLKASIEDREAKRTAVRRRRQRVIAGLVAGLIVISALALFAWGRSQLAERQRVDAENARATAVAEATRALNAEATADARRIEAEVARATADAARQKAEEAQADAEAQQLKAERQARGSKAEQLAAQALNLLNTNEDPSGSLPILLAREAVLTTLDSDGEVLASADTALREAVYKGTSWRKTLPPHYHTRTLNWAAFSPDGKQIVTASDGNMVRLWDAETGEQTRIFEGHNADSSGWVKYAVFSPDGRQIVSTGTDAVRLWDVETGEQTGTLNDTVEIDCAFFSPDGNLIVAIPRFEYAVRLWDAKSGEVIRMLGEQSRPSGNRADFGPYRADFSPDGKLIVTSGTDGAVRFWDVVTGEQIRVIEIGTESVNSVDFSPDGTLIAIAGDRVRLWAVETGTLIRTLTGDHEGSLVSAVFDPDGKKIVTTPLSGNENTIVLWDVETGEQERVVESRLPGLRPATFSPDGKQILAASAYGRKVILWDIETGKQTFIPRGHPYGVSAIAISPDGAIIASAGGGSSYVALQDNAVLLWDVETANQIRTLEGHSGQVRWVDFSPDGRIIVTASTGDNTVRLWDVDTGEQLRLFEDLPDEWQSFDLSPDGRTFVIGSHGKDSGDPGMISLWDVETGERLRAFEGPSDPDSVDFSPDGKQIVTADGNSVTASVWDAETGEKIRTLGDHYTSVYSAVYSPDGEVIATRAIGTVYLWQVETGEQIRILPRDGISSVAFSPDGKLLVTTGGDSGTVWVWDMETGEQIGTLGGHESAYTAAFTPDGTQIVTGGGYADSTIRFWDVEPFEPIHLLEGPASDRSYVSLSPDGRQIATGPSSGLWDSETGKRLHTLGPSTLRPRFSPDGARIVTVTEENRARVWDTTTGALLHDLEGHTADISEVVFDSTGTRLITFSWHDSTAYSWDMETGSRLHTFEDVLSITPSPDATRLASIDAERTAAYVWDVESGDFLHTFAGVSTVTFSPDGKRLAGVDYKEHITYVWDVESGECLHTFAGVSSVGFSPDGAWLAGRHSDEEGTGLQKDISVWNAETGVPVVVFEEQEEDIREWLFSPDGKYMATSSYEGLIRLWELGTGEQIHELRPYGSGLVYMLFSPDGKYLATSTSTMIRLTDSTGFQKGRTELWDVETGKRLRTYEGHTAGVAAMTFTPDGKHLVTVGGSEVGWWKTRIEDLLELAESRIQRDPPIFIVEERLSFGLDEPLANY